MSTTIIKALRAREILDSRGDPTVEVRVELEDGLAARASVPSGASTGIHEALELRDNDPKRYGGKGVLKACRNVNEVIAPKLKGIDATQQQEIDALMIDLDGTKNKSNLGANAILGVSMATAHAAAKALGQPLYQYLRKTYKFALKDYRLPVPLMNIINGGRHADNDLAFQEFMIVPVKARKFANRVRMGSEVFHVLGKFLKERKHNTAVGNEGGYAPNLGTAENVFKLLISAIQKAGYQPGKEIALALDIAASELYDSKSKKYEIPAERLKLSSDGMLDIYESWLKKYPIISIEDGLDQDDWDGWREMTRRLKKKTMLVGDDLFVTNEERLRMGIEKKISTAILIKMNQIGTISETMRAIQLAQKHKYKVVISHRSGETCDCTLADLAVAVNAEYVKTGSLSRSERVAKYNRLMEIEQQLKIV
ncbi:MAG: phosphopyruvate hydratase [Parcubacteria group bacterium]|nr:phosphopyruvate hydratase [Parcubacteria group bacterium]